MARRRSPPDRKSTRLNSSHLVISYAVFCLKKKIQLAPQPLEGAVTQRHGADLDSPTTCESEYFIKDGQHVHVLVDLNSDDQLAVALVCASHSVPYTNNLLGAPLSSRVLKHAG